MYNRQMSLSLLRYSSCLYYKADIPKHIENSGALMLSLSRLHHELANIDIVVWTLAKNVTARLPTTHIYSLRRVVSHLGLVSFDRAGQMIETVVD